MGTSCLSCNPLEDQMENAAISFRIMKLLESLGQVLKCVNVIATDA